MLTNNILNIVKVFNSKNIPIGKTIIQKVIYLTFSEDHRKKFYIPYLYGPYSETVQLMVDSLISSNYIIYSPEKKGLSLSDSIVDKPTKFSEPYEKRFQTVIEFLFNNNFNSTKDVSNLSKINMLVNNNNGHSHDPTFLKDRASLLGWHELANLSPEEINSIVIKSDELDHLLS